MPHIGDCISITLENNSSIRSPFSQQVSYNMRMHQSLIHIQLWLIYHKFLLDTIHCHEILNGA